MTSSVYCPVHRGTDCFAKANGAGNVPSSAYPKEFKGKQVKDSSIEKWTLYFESIIIGIQ